LKAAIDHSQIYSSIRRFLDRKIIVQIEARRQERGPRLKIYKLTEAGRGELNSTAAHYRAVANYLDNKEKRTRE
jgi:DNA-binding PadR family transcriptional regulator